MTAKPTLEELVTSFSKASEAQTELLLELRDAIDNQALFVGLVVDLLKAHMGTDKAEAVQEAFFDGYNDFVENKAFEDITRNFNKENPNA